MALVVETGSASSTAESYIGVAEADAYHIARGNEAWADLDQDVKEAALRNATEYMLAAYGGAWYGYRKTEDQALDWPRIYVPRTDLYYTSKAVSYYPDDAVPIEVRRACAELAWRASSDALLADQERGIRSETVGPISVVYDTYDSPGKRYPFVETMLSKWLVGSGIAGRIVRT